MTPPPGAARPGAGGLFPAVSLYALAELLLRRIWSVLLILVLSVAFATVYAFGLRGNLWVAEAKVLVRLGQEQAPLPTMVGGGQTFVATTPSHVNSEMELFRSRDLIGRLVDRVDISPQPRPEPTSLFGQVKEAARDLVAWVRGWIDDLLVAVGARTRLTPREAAIEAIAGALALETLPNTNVVTARFFWNQRGVPEAVLRQILDLYFEMRSGMFQGTQAVAFFTERRRETLDRLLEAEATLTAFERERGFVNPEDQRVTLQRRLAEADTGLQAARLDLETAVTALRQLEAAQSAGDETLAGVALAGNPLQQSIQTELSTLGARSAGAQTTLNPQDPNVRRQRAEIAALSRQLTDQIRATHAQRVQQLALREAQREALAQDLSALQAELPRWYELRREVDSARRAYEFNDGKLNDSVSVAALEQARIANVQLVQRPTEQATPVGIRKTSIVLLAAALGLMLGLAWMALRSFFDQRMYGPADIERGLGLPVLAVVPRLRRPLAAG